VPVILIIEDHQDLRTLFEEVLVGAGFAVAAAPDGRAGLELFVSVRADLVVVDLILPVVNGIDVIRRIRTASPRIPILAISGGGWRESPNPLGQALSAGATSMLAKPFGISEFLVAVGTALQRPGATSLSGLAAVRYDGGRPGGPI
jgi:DNA-binding response OmpR family regulator